MLPTQLKLCCVELAAHMGSTESCFSETLGRNYEFGSGSHHMSTQSEWRLFARNGSFFMKKIVQCSNKNLLKNLGGYIDSKLETSGKGMLEGWM
jgi:hypothetical protein